MSLRRSLRVRLAPLLATLLAWAGAATAAEETPCTPSGWCTVFVLPPAHVAARSNSPWIKSIWGAGSDAIFAVGRYTTARYDGQAWRLDENQSKSAIFDVSGSGPSDVYAVGSYQMIQRWDGRRWHLEHMKPGGPKSGQFVRVVVTAPGEAYAIGRPTMKRVDGAWAAVEASAIPAPDRPPDGAGEACGGEASPHAASSGRWIALCAGSAKVFVFDAGQWAAAGVLPSIRRGIEAVAVHSRDMIFVAAGNGRVLRFDGTQWLREDEGIPNVVSDFWSDGTWLYATAKDRVLRRRLTPAP